MRAWKSIQGITAIWKRALAPMNVVYLEPSAGKAAQYYRGRIAKRAGSRLAFVVEFQRALWVMD